MYMTAFVFLLLQFTFINTIQVPVWEISEKSDVLSDHGDYSVGNYKPVDFRQGANVMPIPLAYFQYPDIKPQFAVDVAAFHGVKSPEKHYRAYPIRPYTGVKPPNLGHYRVTENSHPIFNKFQKFAKSHEQLNSHISPVSTNFQVFHPYKAEEAALTDIYKDPVLDKIRDDLRQISVAQNQYQKEVENPNVNSEEDLDDPEVTDEKIQPHPNEPTEYENYKPLRQPVYYKYPEHQQPRIQQLNQKFKHPLNQDYVKIKPMHYRPLIGHLQQLRNQHANRYDDEHNEYPAAKPLLDFAEPIEGEDIYENGKSKYLKLRNNIDEEVNKVVLESNPAKYRKLELQNQNVNSADQLNDDTERDNSDDEEDTSEFVPLKSYAQVRRTETMRHLPKSAAFQEADNFEELQNAPRLREAVKSTKAQTVYSEEGYEDSAYDHAGEQKHASDHEGHGGYLKEHELSGGKYKIPTLGGADAKEEDENEQDNTKKLKNKSSISEVLSDSDYDNDDGIVKESDNLDESESRNVDTTSSDKGNNQDSPDDYDIPEPEIFSDSEPETSDTKEVISDDHGVNKRAVEFKVPDVNINDTFLKDGNSLISLRKKIGLKNLKEDLKEKYPYYFSETETVSKDSPLRYSENVKFIPRKSVGGTEFYDSRALVCPDVDDEVDPVPKKVKDQSKEGNDDKKDDDSEDAPERSKRESDVESPKESHRLKGLGDKIDCFKAKFFGSNPLDSPFFKESLIDNPEPLILPKLPIHKFKEDLKSSSYNNVFNITDKLRKENQNSLASLFDQLKQGESKLQSSLVSQRSNLRDSLALLQNTTFPSINKTLISQQSNVYADVLDNIRQKLQQPSVSPNITSHLLGSSLDNLFKDKIPYSSFLNKEDITIKPAIRKKRSTQQNNNYQPYKIIRNIQTTSVPSDEPVSQTIYSNRVVHKPSNNSNRHFRRNVKPNTNKEILNQNKESAKFVDVSFDPRRGEPRYELKPSNHKTEYSPVENKKAMSIEEYKDHAKSKRINVKLESVPTHIKLDRKESPSRQGNHLKLPMEAAASKTISRIIRSTTPASENNPDDPKKENRQKSNEETADENNSDEEYDEYDAEDEKEPETTSTTSRPHIRRRATTTTTTTTSTQAPKSRYQTQDGPEKLRFSTRFNKPTKEMEIREAQLEAENNKPTAVPKYKEKSKKVSESTVVTDSKSYGGDDDDDLKKDEIDAMIHIKHDMDDYLPEYEKEIDQVIEKQKAAIRSDKSDKSKEASKETSSSPEVEEEESESSDDDDGDEDESEESYSNESDEEDVEITTTTTEQTLRKTIPKTTEAPVSTTEAQIAKIVAKPTTVRKKTHIHRELPQNTTSPRQSQFKQDIKQVEVIKEIPLNRRIPSKNVEALDLYKDDSLAKKVNKLRDVEVFRENLDLIKSPRHGGNYKSAKLVELQEDIKPTSRLHGGNLRAKPATDNSESENRTIRKNLRNLPGRSIRRRITNKETTTQSSNDQEVENIPARKLHGGNLKAYKSPPRGRIRQKPAKEFKEETQKNQNDAEDAPKHGGNFKYSRGGRLKYKPERLVQTEAPEEKGTRGNQDDKENVQKHGGNYKYPRERGERVKPEKLIQTEAPIETTVETTEKSIAEAAMTKVDPQDARTNAAKVLSSFAQAVPILTTSPPYILDPSKRMYFYVDA